MNLLQEIIKILHQPVQLLIAALMYAYKDGKGYYGVYCQANGSVSAYSKKELTGYERWYSDYIGKIVCDKTADSNDPYESQWIPLIVYNNLGVEGYDYPDHS